jgi:Uma2 family endonuclease
MLMAAHGRSVVAARKERVAARAAARMVIHDQYLIDKLRKERAATGADKYDEVWDGVLVLMPLPNVLHQHILVCLDAIMTAILGYPGGNPNRWFPGINLSDRVEGWTSNYREPDFAVFLEGNPAENHGTHWVGGPDFAVEIVSTDDSAWDKLPFYAGVGTKEVLIIDRDPWLLELYQLKRGKLKLVGSAQPNDGTALASKVLPVIFALEAGKDRPTIRVRHAATGQEWPI